MGKRPCFMVNVLPGNFGDKLLIPPAFSKHIPNQAPSKVILKGRSGYRWFVELARTRSDPPTFYFNRGWNSFVKDHFLDEDDVLLIKYDGGIRFSVLIFDKSACVKEYAFPLESDSISAADHNVDRKKKRKLGNQFDHALMSIEGANYNADPGSFKSKFPFFVKTLPATSLWPRYTMYIPSSFHEYIKRRGDLVLRDSQGKKWPVSLNHRGVKIYTGWRKFCEANNLKVGNTLIFELREHSTLWVYIFSTLTTENLQKKIKNESDVHPPPEKSSAYKVDPGSFTSNFPFFVKCLTKCCLEGNSSSMYLPSHFNRYVKKEKIVNLHHCGRTWPVSIKRLLQGRMFMVKADWRAFGEAAALKVGDTCIFELREPSSLWVHIYRC